MTPIEERSLPGRLRKRAEIRRQIPTRASVQRGESDRLSDLLDEAANEIERLIHELIEVQWMYEGLQK